MAAAGFKVRYPYFQRKTDSNLELVNLEHDKYGGGFFLEFANHEAGDLHTSWGTIVPEAEIDVSYTDPTARARLLATVKHNGSPKHYFRYESIADDKARCDELIERVVELLPQVFQWLEDGTVGPNISVFCEH